MSDPILALESTEQNCHAVELFELSHGTTTYYLTSADRDVAYGGNVYAAAPMNRGDLGPAGIGNTQKDFQVTLAVDHAFVRRWLAQGVPPGSATCRALRYYPSIDLAEQIWIGPVLSLAVDDNSQATFRASSRIAEAVVRTPTLTLSRSCSHMLYDQTCGIDRGATGPDGFPYKLTTTAMYVNGRTVRLDLSSVTAGHARRADWLMMGELVHVPSGERRTIAEQKDLSPGFSTVTEVTLNLQIYELKTGHAIEVYAGCLWDVATCDLKFNNLGKHSGCPHLRVSNPYVPGTKVS